MPSLRWFLLALLAASWPPAVVTAASPASGSPPAVVTAPRDSVAAAQQLVRQYLDKLQARRPIEALRSYFDTMAMGRAAFGEDFDAMSREDQVETGRALYDMLRLPFGNPRITEAMAQAAYGELEAGTPEATGIPVSVAITPALPDAEAITFVYWVRQEEDGWKIVDTSNGAGAISALLGTGYRAHATDGEMLSPLDFMRIFHEGLHH